MSTANEKQHGGTHYKNLAVQPWDFIDGNNIPFLEGSAIKYLSRWRDKGGVQDLRKAIHFIEKRIELEEAKNMTRVIKSAGLVTTGTKPPKKRTFKINKKEFLKK